MAAYSYAEAVDLEVTQMEAKAEIGKHDVEGGFARFLQEVGDKEYYTGQEVLDWLGY